MVAATADGASAEPDPNEMICRRERATGSHSSRRVCRARAQMEQEQRAVQDLMRHRSGSDPGSGPGDR